MDEKKMSTLPRKVGSFSRLDFSIRQVVSLLDFYVFFCQDSHGKSRQVSISMAFLGRREMMFFSPANTWKRS